MHIILMSMPDVTPIFIHEAAVHLPSLGIASVGGNIDERHHVYLIDLVRKRRTLRKYLTKVLLKIRPQLVGLSAMTWQYDTCLMVARLVKSILPETHIAIGGYHATLMYKEIEVSPEAAPVDFIVRGEGEEAFRRLANALEGLDRLEDILSLSYRRNGSFIHNEQAPPLDLATLKPPIRDQRRLTWGYHIMAKKIEVLETSRGCTRSCNFCSISHMYGRRFRVFPIDRVLADLDDIYYKRKTRFVFIADDNMVLNPQRVIELCDAIIAHGYRNLQLSVQADCRSIAANEEMVRKMAQAGFTFIFLGIENASANNLELIHKENTIEQTNRALEYCRRYGLFVIAGLIVGLPNDDDESIRRTFEYFLTLYSGIPPYIQIITPYPKTRMRQELMEAGLITNDSKYRWYNGLFANVKTQHLSSEELQYSFWFNRETLLGWLKVPPGKGKIISYWVVIWEYFIVPVVKFFYKRKLRKIGWQGLYERDMRRLRSMNNFPDLDQFKV